MTEAEWQQQVIDLAHLCGWHHLHVRRTIGKGRRWVTSTNVVGWPDLFLWHEHDRRQLGIELKVGKGVTSPEQDAVLASLERAGIETHVFYPEDFDELHRVLARRTTAG